MKQPIRITLVDREYDLQEDVTSLEAVRIAEFFTIYFNNAILRNWEKLGKDVLTATEFLTHYKLDRHFKTI